jgi:hypothetical protein
VSSSIQWIENKKNSHCAEEVVIGQSSKNLVCVVTLSIRSVSQYCVYLSHVTKYTVVVCYGWQLLQNVESYLYVERVSFPLT